MKAFFKQALATMVGIFLIAALFSVMGIVSLVSIIASGSSETPIKENSILHLNLSGTLTDRTQENPLDKIMNMGEESNAVSLEQAVTALKKAAVNDNIKGVYLEAGTLSAQPATVQELRQAVSSHTYQPDAAEIAKRLLFLAEE